MYEDQKVFSTDIEGLDLTDKDTKKAVEKALSSKVVRFQKRQRKQGMIWSEPHMDLKAGTATIIYCKVGQYCVEGFEATGKQFNLDCPITGNYMWGNDWYDTH